MPRAGSVASSRTVVRSDEEIDEQLNRASASADSGRSAYPGMTYEEGVKAAIEWLTIKDEGGLDGDEPPIPEPKE